MKIKFTSEWDSGEVITTDGVLHVMSGRVDTDMVDVDPDSCLIREYITLPDGEELDVCEECHEYILRRVMIDDNVGIGLTEVTGCLNRECRNSIEFK